MTVPVSDPVLLANLASVAALLGRPLTGPEEARVEPMLARASAEVLEYLGRDPRDPTTGAVPYVVAQVVAGMVARFVEQADAIAEARGANQWSQQVGGLSQSYTYTAGQTSGLPWMNLQDRRDLRSYRAGGGLATVRLGTVQTGRYRGAGSSRNE